jgi:hypothetical protein
MKEQPPFYKTGTSRSPFYQEISGKENRQIKKAVKKVTKGRKKWNQAEEILSIGGDGKVKSSPETPRDERKLKASTRKTQKGRGIYKSLSEEGKAKAQKGYEQAMKEGKHLPRKKTTKTLGIKR